jgi:succinoglycan biosynthesis protein ExoM
MPGDKPRASARPLFVCLAIATHRRPRPLAEVLAAVLSIEIPPDCRLHIVVTDNDPGRSGETIFKSFSAKATMPVSYVVEPQPGIPHARNRCLREAERLDADLLVFIDDDETPAPDWLARLVAHHRKTGGQLIGGPVAMRAETAANLSPWQKLVLKSMIAWAARKARRARREADRGREVTVVTNNWLGDLRFIRENGLSFSANFAASGGSDTAFFREAVAKGIRHGWCADAIVYDRIPAERISLLYQFRRARAQSINHFHMRHPDVDNVQRLKSFAVAIARIAIGAVGLVIPVSGAASLVLGVRSMGWGFGRLDALAGKRSEFYSRGG